MDLSYDADIDTRCVGCGASAEGWTFASDGTRVYVCPDCAEPLYRTVPDSRESVPPHPEGQFCRACDRLTLQSDLSHQTRCPDCRGAAGERQLTEQEPEPETDGGMPPEVAAARADAQGQVDWDDETDG